MITEEETRQLYSTHMKNKGHHSITVKTCGLFISLENPWLAASPDGLVEDPSKL